MHLIANSPTWLIGCSTRCFQTLDLPMRAILASVAIQHVCHTMCGIQPLSPGPCGRYTRHNGQIVGLLGSHLRVLLPDR